MNVMIIMDVVIVVFGLYLIYIALQMKKTKKVNSFIVDEQTLRMCKDQSGFAEYLYPKMLFFAVVLTITGGIRVIDDVVYDIGYFAYGVAAIAFLAFLLFFKQLSDGKSKFC